MVDVSDLENGFSSFLTGNHVEELINRLINDSWQTYPDGFPGVNISYGLRKIPVTTLGKTVRDTEQKHFQACLHSLVQSSWFKEVESDPGLH